MPAGPNTRGEHSRHRWELGQRHKGGNKPDPQRDRKECSQWKEGGRNFPGVEADTCQILARSSSCENGGAECGIQSPENPSNKMTI